MVNADQFARSLPPEVRELAMRLGATGGASLSSVTLSQSGTMRDKATARPMRFAASQTISLLRSEFEWRASAGPFGCISVVDRMDGEGAALEVRLFHALRIAHLKGGAALAKGDVMRYLAELAWAPDAILTNPSLEWDVVSHQTFRVGTGYQGARGEVELRLDNDGRIACVMAKDRPRKEATGFVERPWQGRFFDYRTHQERWLPFQGEVAWVVDGQAFVAWRGQILGWVVA